MRNSILSKYYLIFLALSFISCKSKQASYYTSFKKRQIDKWSPLLNQKVTLKGEARHRKNGATLFLRKDSISLWIENTHWPLDYYTIENQSKILEVTGTLIEKYDLPVFRSKKLKPGEIEKQGIPIPYGINLKLASHRFLIKDATWKIVKE